MAGARGIPLSKVRLVVLPRQERHIPRYSVGRDYRWFTRESLVRLYGEKAVSLYEASQRGH